MTRNRERAWSFKRIRKDGRKLGEMFVYLWGSKQQQALDDEQDEHTRLEYTYTRPDDPMTNHIFIGTPAEIKRFKADHPEWFLESEWKA
jgi:hypothetical protein